MTSHHSWGWQPPQTASCIHIKHIQSVWAHWYAVHGHHSAALNRYCYTPTTWLRIWGSGSLVLWHWHDVIVSWLRLTATSNCFLHTYMTPQSVLAHWYAVHQHMVVVVLAALGSYPHYLAQMLCSGSLVDLKYLFLSGWGWLHLKLQAAFILVLYIMFEHIDMLSISMG